MVKTASSGKARLLDDGWSDRIPLRTDLDPIKRAEFEANWMQVKLGLLAGHFNIAIGPNWGHMLALRLAQEFVEGFAIAENGASPVRKRGRPRGARKIDRWELVRVIEQTKREWPKQGPRFRIKDACERLSRPRPCDRNRQFKGKSPESLRVTYHSAINELNKMRKQAEALSWAEK